jgi:hypothetical protein
MSLKKKWKKKIVSILAIEAAILLLATKADESICDHAFSLGD